MKSAHVRSLSVVAGLGLLLALSLAGAGCSLNTKGTTGTAGTSVTTTLGSKYHHVRRIPRP